MNCNITLSTCGGDPNIEIAINHIPWNKAINIATVGLSYFRDIRICNNETGEIMYNRYVAEDVFQKDMTLAKFNKYMAEVLA